MTHAVVNVAVEPVPYWRLRSWSRLAVLRRRHERASVSPRFESMRPERLQQELLRGEPAAWNWLRDEIVKPVAARYAKKATARHGAQYEADELVCAALSRAFEALHSWKGGNLVGYLRTAAENALKQFHTEQHAGTAGRSDLPRGNKGSSSRGAPRLDAVRVTEMLDFSAAFRGGFVSAAEFVAFEAAFDVAGWELDSATFLSILRESETISAADAEKRVNAVCARVLLGSLAAKSSDGLARLVDAAKSAHLVSDEDAEAVRAYLALAPQERAALLGVSKSSGVSKRWSDPVRRVVSLMWFAADETEKSVETLADDAGREAALDAMRLDMISPDGELARRLVATLDEPLGSDRLLREWIDRTRRKGDRVLSAIRSWTLLLDLAAAARTLMRFEPSQTDLALAGCLGPFMDPCAPQDGVCPRCGTEGIRRPHQGAWCLTEMVWRERDGRLGHPLWRRWGRPGAKQEARHAFSRLLSVVARLQGAGDERIARAIARERAMLWEEDLDVLLEAVVRVARDTDRRCS